MKSQTIQNLLKEPEAFSGLEYKYDRIVSVLGGSRLFGHPVTSDIDLIEITRKGLPVSVVASISRVLGISMEKMSIFLHISHRTIQRK